VSRKWRVVVLLAMTGAMGACSKQDETSDSSEPVSESRHPWTEQEKALQKARQVEQDMMDAFKRRDEEMEKQMR